MDTGAGRRWTQGQIVGGRGGRSSVDAGAGRQWTLPWLTQARLHPASGPCSPGQCDKAAPSKSCSLCLFYVDLHIGQLTVLLGEGVKASRTAVQVPPRPLTFGGP